MGNAPMFINDFIEDNRAFIVAIMLTIFFDSLHIPTFLNLCLIPCHSSYIFNGNWHKLKKTPLRPAFIETGDLLQQAHDC